MVKKNTGGKKFKKRKNENDGVKTHKIPDKKVEGQEYGQVTKLLGNCRLEVNCFDGTTRLCHIRGSMRKKVWIKINDVVLVSLRDFEDSKADIIYKYDLDEVTYLKKEKEIPENVKIHDDIVETKDLGIDFVEEGDEEEEEEEVEKKEINFDDI